MIMNEVMWFGSKVQLLMNKQDLDRATIKKMFTQVLSEEQPELQQGAFLAALAAKGETAEEIAGVWEAIRELDTVKVELKVDKPILDNCGTGMDPLKTFNISTAASIIAASEGVLLARHGARAITSKCGTVDLAEVLGVDVEAGVHVAKKSVEQCGLGLFNGMSPEVHPKGLFRILSQIRFGTTLNIAGSLASPVLPQLGVRGVFKPDMVDIVAQVMREIGYEEAYVFHGLRDKGQPGMDEISTLGPTVFCRLKQKGHLERFTLEPEELGLKRATAEELAPARSPQAEAVGLVRLLSGRDNGARLDAVCLNAAPMFLLAGRVQDFRAGIELAREVVFSAKGLEKLEEWVSRQNRAPKKGLARFEEVLRQAGVKVSV
jgi:anthranilate phosphoribosyltransferase